MTKPSRNIHENSTHHQFVFALRGGLRSECGSEPAANGKKGDTQASQAKISRAQAERTALKEVPNGTVKEGELEKEKGRLIWSFDIATPGTKNITEVQVDAIDGNVVSKATETPAEESRESAKEKKPQSGGAGSSESD